MKPNTRNLKVPTTRRWPGLAFAAVGVLVSWQAGGAVGSWIPLETKVPGTNAGHMLLLSDATVMVQQGVTSNWWRLTPSSTGGYTNGTWAPLSPMSTSRKFYSSDVLRDGRVFVAGGEHNNPVQTNNGEIYNPLNDRWTLTPSAGDVNFSDSGSVVLSDGTVLVHPVNSGTNPAKVNMIYSPGSDSWIVGPTNIGPPNEASWVKLPDDSILTVDRGTTNSERYIPSLNQWIKDADLPVALFANSEIGAAFLLPDSRAFFLGASGRTALYSASGTTNQGSWAAGPDIPDGRFADDAPAAMMSNGKILCVVGTNAPNGGSTGSLWFVEYDYSIGTTGAFQRTSSPTDSAVDSFLRAASYDLSLLDLPDGTVLFSKGNGTPDPAGLLYVYRPGTPPLPAGKPTITSITAKIAGVSYHLTGTKLNGISAGAAFGDDAQMDSNYPIVRLTDSGGNVFYARTYNWSSTGVMTGSRPVTTEFDVPGTVPPGTYSLAVVANGNPSAPVSFTYNGPVWVDFNYTIGPENGSYAEPYDTLVKGTNNVSSGGTIAIKPGSSLETMTISKPMTITAVGGAATVGH
jgi:Kelch motif protein